LQDLGQSNTEEIRRALEEELNMNIEPENNDIALDEEQ